MPTKKPRDASDSTQTVIDDNERGCIHSIGNALMVDSKIPDAAEIRVGAPRNDQCAGGGKYAFDVVDVAANGLDTSRREIVNLCAGEGAYGAEFKLILLKKGGNTVDADQIAVLQATAEGVEFLKPVRFSAGATGADIAPPSTAPPAAPTHVQSPNGRYQLHGQDDGNLVWYDTSVHPWAPLWSSGTARADG